MLSESCGEWHQLHGPVLVVFLAKCTYSMSFLSSRQTLFNSDAEIDLIENLKKIPFIPLSDGTYSSVNEGTIWLQSDALSAEIGRASCRERV